MAALTAIALGATIGSLAYGAYESNQGKQQAQQGLQEEQQGYQIEQQAAKQQADISKAQAASSVTYAGQERDIEVTASQQSVAASQASQGINANIVQGEESIQSQQLQAAQLASRRSSLQAIRDQQSARAMGLTAGVAQGGSGFVGGSSARGGAYGQASGTAVTSLAATSQDLQGTENIYGLNLGINQQKLAMNDLQTQYAIEQANNQTSKSNLAYSYAQTNAGYQTQLADTQTLMAQGQGLVNMGSGMVQGGQMQSQTGQQFISGASSIFSAGNNFNQLQGSTFGNFSLPGFNFLFGGGSPTGIG
jgi:hypothetical protein